jgi:hypothetical protein
MNPPGSPRRGPGAGPEVFATMNPGPVRPCVNPAWPRMFLSFRSLQMVRGLQIRLKLTVASFIWQ